MESTPKAACLLVHGFGGAPFEMEPLIAPLRAAGLDARAPALPGHATTIDEFVRTTFDDWAGAVLAWYRELRAQYAKVFIVGMSMGGTLALRTAASVSASTSADESPAGIVTIASPLYLYRFYPWKMTDPRLLLLPILRRIRPLYPVPPRDPSHLAIAPWQGYDGYVALEPLASFMEGIRQVRRNLSRVTCPVLSLHCPTDRTCPASCSWDIQAGVSSAVRRLVLMSIDERITRHHLLTTHIETRDRVRDEVLMFLQGLL